MRSVLLRHFPSSSRHCRASRIRSRPGEAPHVIELAPGVYSLGHKKGGHVHAFLIDDGGELTLVDTLFEGDARLVLEAIDASAARRAT